MKSIFSLKLCVIIATIFTSALVAVNAQELKIALVDMSYVESNATVISSLAQALQAKQKEMQKNIDDKSQELQKRAKAIEDQKSFLSAMAIDEKRKELEASLMSFQTEAQKKNEAIQRAKTSALADVDAKIREIVSEISTKNTYNLVLANQVTLYFSKDSFTDISAQVVEVLNKKFPSISIEKYITNSPVSSAKKIKK
jgi:Skp family chaperone for outer membrane proteins